MADKAISELISAEQITATDMFVLEQNGTAKKLTGQVLLNWLTKAADGHGGIQSVRNVSTSGLADTYRITLADTTTFDFVVTNGKSINGIAKTDVSGLVDTYTINYNDGTTDTFTVTNGAKGEQGDNAYVWIKYASQKPTPESNSFGDVPDDWMGVCFGNLASAPADWTRYQWFRIKGEPGNTGEPAVLISAVVTYQVGESGSVIPSGTWNESIPAVAQGKFLWTRIVQNFNTGDPVTAYTVSRMGIDGLGSVVSVCGVDPDENGNVALDASRLGALPLDGGTMSGPVNMDGKRLSGLNAPEEDSEAANKGYVDNNTLQGKESAEYPGCYYRTVNGVTEWFNPPMLPGVEYRTVDRYNNKPVYTKRVRYTYSGTLGTASGETTIIIPHDISGLDSSLCVSVTGAFDAYLLPCMKGDGFIFIFGVVSGGISLKFRNATMTGTTGNFIIRYVRE